MNVYDSERMADVLAPLGYERTESPDGADLVIFNTCHIREKATDKVFSELGRLKPFKTEKEAAGGKMIIAVAGCVAQAEGDFLLKRAPFVDMVFGPQNYHRLPEMVAKASNQRVINTDFPEEEKFDYLPEEHAARGVCAFLSVQEGCDKFCTYCVVPYTRGAEYSRSADSILEEARRLAGSGVKEITLLGQNVNAWHGETPDGKTWGLGRLIDAVSEIGGIERIRYTTSHPQDMEQELIDAHRDNPKLMPFLHLPVQSGSDKILKAMNRKHKAEDYIETVGKIRMARADIALSCDFIVGFPGESERDFEDTLDLIRKVKFASAYSFNFSPRPGTPAAAMDNQIPDEVKSERLAVLQELINGHQLEFNRSMEGKIMPVLFDGTGSGKDGNPQLHGRTPYNQAVHIEAQGLRPGNIVDIIITKGLANSVRGRIAVLPD